MTWNRASKQKIKYEVNRLAKAERQFEQEMTLKGVLYLIGVQELNLGIKQYKREEKVNVLHVAICKILTPFGFYKFNKINNF